jgi:hypothetical protein
MALSVDEIKSSLAWLRKIRGVTDFHYHKLRHTLSTTLSAGAELATPLPPWAIRTSKPP